jgi:hypothetical protein
MRLSIFSFWKKSHNKVEMRRKKLDSLLSAISLINWSVNHEALNALHLKV